MSTTKEKVVAMLANAKTITPDPAPAAEYPNSWRVTSLDNISPKIGSDYLIKGLINRGELDLIYGESGSGKTFFAVDIALRIATGMQWRDRRMSQGVVMYLAIENPSSVRNRVFAWRQHYKPALGTPFLVADTTLNFQALAAEKQLIEAYKAALTAHPDHKPGAIVIDTLSRAMPGADENSAEAMTQFIGACDRVRHATGAAIIVIHHSGKDLERGARGHSSLKAAVDVELKVHDKVATATKVRDGAVGQEYPFSLEAIHLGNDADGDAVGTCIVAAQPEQAARPKKMMKPVGKNQTVVYDAIRELIAKEGQMLPATSEILAPVKAVLLEHVIDKATPKVVGDTAAKKRGRIQEAITSMQDKGVVSVLDPYVWITR